MLQLTLKWFRQKLRDMYMRGEKKIEPTCEHGSHRRIWVESTRECFVLSSQLLRNSEIISKFKTYPSPQRRVLARKTLKVEREET